MVVFEASGQAALAALGKNANTVTPPVAESLTSRPSGLDRHRRRLRLERRQQSRAWLLDDAVDAVGPEQAWLLAARPSRCGWAASSHVGIHKGDKGARYSGLQTCASIWACPTCSPVIRSRRAAEVQQAANWWVAEHQGYFQFATFTLRHKLTDSLERSMKALTGAFTRLIRGAPWKRFAELHSIRHMIKSVEVTFSYNNGWHAHLHVLFFTATRENGAALEQARDWLSDRWAAMVVKEGGRLPSKDRGVDLRMVQDGQVVAEYITKLQEHDEPNEKLRQRQGKIGLEMTRTDLKRGRKESLVPFDLLDLDGLDEYERDRARGYWLEYVEATRGRRATTWSRGLKDEAGINDLSDDEIVEADAAEVKEDLPVVYIAARNWRYVMNRPDVVALFLELVEDGRADEIAEWVPMFVATGPPPAAGVKLAPLTDGQRVALARGTSRPLRGGKRRNAAAGV